MKFKIRFLTAFEMTINTTPNHKKISVIQSAAKELNIFTGQQQLKIHQYTNSPFREPGGLLFASRVLSYLLLWV